MIKVFDRDKAGAIAYLDEKKIESVTFEKESFFEPNVEAVYWNKLEDKFFLEKRLCCCKNGFRKQVLFCIRKRKRRVC